MTEYQLRQKFVDILWGWVGLNETDKSHRKIIDLYNSQTELPRNYRMNLTDAWCAATVSAAAIKCGIADIIPPECSCTRMIAQLKNIGAWVENDGYSPSPGDLIFYDWQDSGKGDNTGVPDHVGVVESLVARTFVVIEGNYHDAVGRRKMAVNGKFIRGFGVPDFRGKAQLLSRLSADVTDENAVKINIQTDTILNAIIAQQVIDGKWGNGDVRRDALTAAGYDPVSVQKIVNALVKNTFRVQITANILNVREGPGTNYKKLDIFGAGVIVTVEEIREGTGASAWGRVGNGWIALDWTTPV